MDLAAGKTGALIVVADDEPDIRAFIRAILLRNGYGVLEAEDGFAAYELIQSLRGKVELLITDVEMPRMDGWVLGSKIGAEYPNIAVLYISGFVLNPPDSIPSQRFLHKPFTPEELAARVQTLLMA